MPDGKSIADNMKHNKKSKSKPKKEDKVIFRIERREIDEDIEWYKQNILPGFMTWVDTVDPLLFVRFSSISTLVAASKTTRVQHSTAVWNGQYSFTYAWLNMEFEKLIRPKDGSDKFGLDTIQSHNLNTQVQSSGNSSNGQESPMDDVMAWINSFTTRAATSATSGSPIPGNEDGNNVYIFMIDNPDGLTPMMIQQLKNAYLRAWGVSELKDGYVLPEGIPKIIFLPTMPMSPPDALRRSAIFVNFDSHTPGSKFVQKIRNSELYSNENVEKLSSMAFPPTLLESTVACSPTLDVDSASKLLSTSLISSTPGLTRIENPKSEEEIGGFGQVKTWAKEIKDFMESDEYEREERPKNVLIVGPPGTGKSVTAKALSNILGWPGLQLDISDMLAGLQGQSERNLKTALNTIRSMGKCIVLMDEVEKDLGGSMSSNRTDGGVLLRIVKAILQFTESDEHDAIFVMTANDVNSIPAPLMRSGRMDIIFHAGLPRKKHREAIMKIYLEKFKFGHLIKSKEAMDRLMTITDKFTGSEVEDLVKKVRRSMIVSGDRKKKLTPDEAISMFEKASSMITPVAKSRAEDIKGITDWAKHNATSVDNE